MRPVVKVEGGKLFIAGSRISTRFRVEKALVFRRRILVLLDPLRIGKKRTVLNQNIYCYSQKGVKLWTVRDNRTPLNKEENPYVAIRIESRKLVLHKWNGIEYIVDISTGKVSYLRFRRF